MSLFGTDGIRGLANSGAMTGETAMAVGRALAHVLQNRPDLHGKTSLRLGIKPLYGGSGVRRAKIVVGKDTRLSGYMLENALASGICSMGADVILIGPLPTPGVAYITHSIRADAGVMISASHNPYSDNGLKLFSSDGYKLEDSLEKEIERLVLSNQIHEPRPTGDLVGKAFRIDDVHYRYLVYLKNLFAKDLDLLGTKVAVDCANGAAYKTAPLVFEELGAEVFKTGVSPNGLNINQRCGALHPENVAFVVAKMGADIGVALDGDGDRCILVDDCGEVVDGDQIIGLCALDMMERGELTHHTVVTTPMSNQGLEVFLNQKNIKMIRSKVGDRHVLEEMRRGGFALGGEQSGHILFKDLGKTGDGILAALRVIEVMKRKQKKLSELRAMIPLFPQMKAEVPIAKKIPIESLDRLPKKIAQIEGVLGDTGRVFVRYSGTESVLRILLEGEDKTQLSDFLAELLLICKEELI